MADRFKQNIRKAYCNWVFTHKQLYSRDKILELIDERIKRLVIYRKFVEEDKTIKDESPIQ